MAHVVPNEFRLPFVNDDFSRGGPLSLAQAPA